MAEMFKVVATSNPVRSRMVGGKIKAAVAAFMLVAPW